MPDKLHDVFVADIAHCYEAIPLKGSNNLMGAISKLIKIVFQQRRIDHPKSEQSLWVWFDENKMDASTTRWASHNPCGGLWVEITEDRLVCLNTWLSSNCFVTLGDEYGSRFRESPWVSLVARSGAICISCITKLVSYLAWLSLGERTS